MPASRVEDTHRDYAIAPDASETAAMASRSTSTGAIEPSLWAHQARWEMRGVLGLAGGLPMVIAAR